MAKMNFDFQSIGQKIKSLPPWGKAAIVTGIGLFIYAIYRGRQSNKDLEESYATSTDPYTYNDPYGINDLNKANGTLGDLEESGSGSSSGNMSDYLTYDDLYNVYDSLAGQITMEHEQQLNWNNSVLENINDSINNIMPSGVSDSLEFREGNIIYTNINGQVYKNNKPVSEENMKYIPQEVGGSRTTGSGLGTTTNKKTTSTSKKNNASGSTAKAKTYREGGITYTRSDDGTIRKDGKTVAKENMKYIPQAIGGSRQ